MISMLIILTFARDIRRILLQGTTTSWVTGFLMSQTTWLDPAPYPDSGSQSAHSRLRLLPPPRSEGQKTIKIT
jgi:hypothetical protein